jgi:integrase
MSVRKRTWKTAAGEERQAWLCDYTGQSGKRHVKTFARKKDADAFIAKAKVEVREGIHTRIAIASRSAMPRTFG